MAGQSYSTVVGGSSNPEPGGLLYFATVHSISNGKLRVNVPMLGFISSPCDHLNSYGNDRYAVGDRVVVGFLEGGKQYLVLFGRVNHTRTAFPTYGQYLALAGRVSALESTVATLQAAVTALQGHTH